MRIEDYQALAMRTSPEGHDRQKNGCMGLIGEAGEVVDVVKKWLFQSGDGAPLPVDALIKECGDVLWYCAELATGLDEKLSSLYRNYSQDYEGDNAIADMGQPIDALACQLSAIAYRPWVELYDQSEIIPHDWGAVRAKAWIVAVMVTVDYILEKFCHSSLEEAMERNINKLRERYPEGFDPERSLHRNE